MCQPITIRYTAQPLAKLANYLKMKHSPELLVYKASAGYGKNIHTGRGIYKAADTEPTGIP